MFRNYLRRRFSTALDKIKKILNISLALEHSIILNYGQSESDLQCKILLYVLSIFPINISLNKPQEKIFDFNWRSGLFKWGLNWDFFVSLKSNLDLQLSEKKHQNSNPSGLCYDWSNIYRSLLLLRANLRGTKNLKLV